MITLLSNVAIQDTSNTANIVYLNNIMEGVDGAATFGYTLEPTAVKVDDNQTQQYMHEHTFDIRVLQGAASDLTKLKVIDAGNIPVKVAGHSPDGFFVINEPAQLTYQSQYDSVIADRVLVTTTDVNGYGGEAPDTRVPVYAGDNLLAVHKVDSGNATILNGFTTSIGTTSVSGSELTMQSNAAVTTDPQYFPFGGLDLVAGVEIVSGTACTIGFLTYPTSSFVQQSVTGTGVKTFNVTTPSPTTNVVFILQATSGNVVVKNPFLRLQGSSFSL